MRLSILVTKAAAIVTSIMFIASVLTVSTAQAAMVTTESKLQQQTALTDAPIGKEAVSDIVASEQVKTLLLELGVSPEQVAERVDRMTPSEIAMLNQQIDELPAGGTSVVGLVVFVLVLLIVLDLLGATNIFPAVKPINQY